MRNDWRLPTVRLAASLAGGVIGSRALHAFLICLVLSALSGSTLKGQTSAPSQPDSTASNSGVTSSSTQAENTPKPARPDDTFVIGNDDVLSVNVWKEPELTKQVPVRTDGKISLPLIGEVQAAGRTPLQLEQDITVKLQSYITDPQVTIIVQEINSLKFNVLGQVTKPGSYPLTTGTTVVDAIAIAGGLKDFAKKKDIYVLRQISPGNEYRFTFNYNQFVKGKNTKQNIVLKPHDTVVVP